MKVTPETLTDEMIVEAFKIEATPDISFRDAWHATSDEPESRRKHEARVRICAALNVRANGGAR